MNTEQGITQYEWLLIRANAAVRCSPDPVYVVGIDRYELDVSTIRDMRKRIPETRNAIYVNDTLDVIVTGDLSKAEELGEAIFRCTGQPAGIIQYDPDNEAGTYVRLKSAIKAARREDDSEDVSDILMENGLVSDILMERGKEGGLVSD